MSKQIAKVSKKTWLVVSLTIVTLVLGGVIVWLMISRQDPQLSTALEKVGRHMVLPTSETPTLAVVEDSSKLQSSLKKVAATNDIVLVYSKTGYVVVYRPSIDKIISVQPVLTGAQGDASLNVTVAVYNGSGNDDTLTAFISALYEKYPNVRLIVKDTAPRTFPTTIAYASSDYATLAMQVAEGLSIKQGITPEGMSDTVANVIFIVGKDYK